MSFARLSIFAVLALFTLSSASSTSDSCDSYEKWIAQIFTVSIIGVVLSIIALVIGCLPTSCCCCVKGCGCYPKIIANAKPIAASAILLGVLSLLLPWIGSMSATSAVVKEMCADTDCYYGGCTDYEEDDLRVTLNALGFFTAYLFALGWLPLVVGGIASCFGCGTLCGCCKPQVKGVDNAVNAV